MFCALIGCHCIKVYTKCAKLVDVHLTNYKSKISICYRTTFYSIFNISSESPKYKMICLKSSSEYWAFCLNYV